MGFDLPAQVFRLMCIRRSRTCRRSTVAAICVATQIENIYGGYNAFAARVTERILALQFVTKSCSTAERHTADVEVARWRRHDANSESYMNLGSHSVIWTVRSAVLLAVALIACAAISQSPSTSLVVLNKDDNTLAIVDPASLKVVATIPTGTAPHEVAVSADGKFAYVTNYGQFGAAVPGHTLSVIDLVNHKELRQVDLTPLGRPHGIEFANGQVYFTAEVNKAIARYSPATNQVDWVMGTGQDRTHMLFLNKDLSKIFTSNVNSGTVSIFERSSEPSGWTATVIAVGKGPEGGSLSPDEKEFWAANSEDGSVSIIDVASKRVTQTIDVQTKHSNRLKFTPDGHMVLISDLGSGDVVVLDAATRKVVKRLNVGRNAEGILVAPDGSRAYVAASADDKVAIIDLKTLQVVGSIHTGKGPDGMAWAVR